MLPEFRVPQSMLVHKLVACGSLKTLTLTVFVVMLPPPRCPWAGTFCWAISTPAVTAESAIAVKTRRLAGLGLLFLVACVSPILLHIKS